MLNGTNGKLKARAKPAKRRKCCKKPTEAEAKERNQNCHDARIAIWERLMRVIETTEVEVEKIAECVMEAREVNEALERLAELRCQILSSRPRMVGWWDGDDE